MLVEKGDLKEVLPLKVLLGVVESNLTGILYFKKEEILKVLYFNNGKLTWAISKDVKDSLFSLILERKLIDQSVLEDIVKQVDKEEFFGKRLVELGLLSLENLIDLTKEQLKRIVVSVLDWEYGTFQFAKDTPPERFFSLDIDVIFYIKHYIANVITLDKIWHVVGSMQNEFIYSINENKFKLLTLTDSQKDLLYKFKGDINLETILARYNSEQRDSVLRNVYFFLQTGLLIKREFDTYSENVKFSDIGKELDEKFKKVTDKKEENKMEINFENGFEADKGFDKPENKDNININNEKRINYVFEENTNKTKDEVSQIEKPDYNFDVQKFIEKEHKKNSKLYFVLITLVVLFFVIGGVIFIIISSNKIEEEFGKKNMIELNESQTVKEHPINIKETTLIKEDSNATKANKKEIEQKKEDKSIERESIAKQKKGYKPVKKDENLTNNSKLVSQALSYLKNKRFLIAIDLWKQVIVNSGYKYSILLELDCLKSSVLYSFNKFKNKNNFFILSRVKNGRQCYLVFWGRFLTKDEAKIGLKSIPEYFWKQSDPPEVVELSLYIK